ncbi:MAG: CheR family methyltransferase [Casimicrobiaceae bacterium]
MLERVTQTHWSQLSELIAEKMGLHFPHERLVDLQRGMAAAARELGFADVTACVRRLLSAPPSKVQLQVLAHHLTVGETYFFRDKKVFDVLGDSILPELICSRRNAERRLRIWSAACSTGEEAYSLAIALRQVLPDWRDWGITILATDINGRFLHRAATGIYGEWSFRDAPSGLRERYFERMENGDYAILPEIRKLVTFAHLNLVEDIYPSMMTATNAMDIIFCRNVLMYFAAPEQRKAVAKLHRAMVEGGWLVVSPSEASHSLFPQFVTVNFPGAILFQKSDAKARISSARARPSDRAELVAAAPEISSPWVSQTPSVHPIGPPPALLPQAPTAMDAPTTPGAAAETLYQQGRYAEAADALLAVFAARVPDAPAICLLARALANQGKLADALTWCDRWIAADKLNPAGHYLRAIILLEQGDKAHARTSLQRAVYLSPEFVLAHFALGNLARSAGRNREADKHFANALHLLGGYQPDDALPESDGLTAGRLTETITAIAHTP